MHQRVASSVYGLRAVGHARDSTPTARHDAPRACVASHRRPIWEPSGAILALAGSDVNDGDVPPVVVQRLAGQDQIQGLQRVQHLAINRLAEQCELVVGRVADANSEHRTPARHAIQRGERVLDVLCTPPELPLDQARMELCDPCDASHAPLASGVHEFFAALAARRSPVCRAPGGLANPRTRVCPTPYFDARIPVPEARCGRHLPTCTRCSLSSSTQLSAGFASPTPRAGLSTVPRQLRNLADTVHGLLERPDSAFDAQRRFVANPAHELRIE
jgi:hypothetical protein